MMPKESRKKEAGRFSLEDQIKAAKVVLHRTDQLIPYARNARKHEPWQVAQIAASIKEFGFTNPVLIDETGEIVAGHGRVMAALKLNLEEVPCIVLRHLTPTQRRAYVIADNQLALNSTWDTGLLGVELEELKVGGFDLDLLGFGDDELKAILDGANGVEGTEGLTDPDEVPEVEKPIVSRGEVWVLGNHRLMCGDSTAVTDVEKLMGGHRAKLFATDPPYGINHVEVSQEKGQSKGYKKIANDDLQDEALKEFLFSAISTGIAAACENNFAFYMWHAVKKEANIAAAAAAGILFHRQIIWVKPHFVFGRGQYHWRHELCLMGWLQGNEPPFYGERNQSTVWEIGRENDKIHPTQKPVAISEIPILNHTKPGEICYEPFSGSGGQLIAAEKLGRRCFGMELEPHYCTVILKRWAQFTGKEPHRLEEDGSLTPMAKVVAV